MRWSARWSGPPRRPARIRVARPALAESVRRAAGDDIEIVVAPTPELDDVLEAMMRAPLENDAPEQSYFEQGRVSADIVADFRPARFLGATFPPSVYLPFGG